METNDLGFVASLMFVLVPAVFLIILYIQTNSRQSGGSPGQLGWPAGLSGLEPPPRVARFRQFA